jgi:hypothetical protein
MMLTAYMWCYLWDVLDEGIDRVLDQMQWVGVDGVSIATVYHSIEHFRMHAALGDAPRAYIHPGAAYFQPEAGRYANTRLRPIVAEWLKTRNPLVDLGKACGDRGLRLRSWTVCCHNSAMVQRRPEVAIKNVFGDVNPTWMCPLNPDVGEYLRAIVEDLSSNYPFEAIELESPAFNAARHYHTHVKMGLAPGKVEQFLLSLCFCESCRQAAIAADIDIEMVVRSVRVELGKWFANATPSGETAEELLGRNPPLKAFVQWRMKQVSGQIRRIRSACRCELVVYDEPDVYGSALDLADVANDVNGVVGCCYGPETELIDRTVKWLSAAMGGKERLSIGLMTYPPASADAPMLVRNVHHIAELGVPSVHLYHHGIMPDVCLTWARQALRKPRREA